MAKTYTAAGTVAAGDVYTAAAHNIIATDVNNFIVPPLCRVRRATTQSIANSTDTFVSYTIEDFDTDGMFTATSDTITIQTAGVYIVSATTIFAANATGWRVMQLMKTPSSAGDNATIFGANWAPVSSASQATVLSATASQSFAAGNTVKVAVAQNSGGPLDIVNTGFTSQTNLCVTWVGRTS
jgi:hypothetical protein